MACQSTSRESSDIKDSKYMCSGRYKKEEIKQNKQRNQIKSKQTYQLQSVVSAREYPRPQARRQKTAMFTKSRKEEEEMERQWPT
jgi:hypothetical protein